MGRRLIILNMRLPATQIRRVLPSGKDRLILSAVPHHWTDLILRKVKLDRWSEDLKQAVRRNIKRFPDDFMFELTKEEKQSLRSQNVTLKRGQHSKYLPFAFTEQGVAMLSSVLNSERAVEVKEKGATYGRRGVKPN